MDAMILAYPRPRWFQFSLRGLLLAVTVLAVWLGWTVHTAVRQKQIKTEIREAGGWWAYDYQLTGGQRPTLPWGLDNHLGIDFLAAVHYVALTDSDRAQELLPALSELRDVREIRLVHCDVSDDDLAQLAGLRGLTRLSLNGSPITDAALKHVARIRSLTELDLRNTNVSDAGLAHLHSLANLTDVYVWETRVTADGAKRLQAHCPRCRVHTTESCWTTGPRRAVSRSPRVPAHIP